MHTTQLFTRSLVYLAALMVLFATSARAEDETITPPENEQDLLAIIRSDAPAAEKAITCKLLAIHGSSESVPDLAKLLPDEQLSSWARIALEAIPGAAADDALRNAADSLQGRLLVGIINSIGVRRDANAIDALTTRLRDDDSEVASAAAVALGHIGNEAATSSLREALAAAPVKVRSAVAEGCVLCAERLHSAGKSAEATVIYDEVRAADVPKQRIIEATRGAILARHQDGIPLLLEQFRSSDNRLFQLALSTAREFPGDAVDKALAAEMVRATPERGALMIQAMADRPETVVLAAVLKAANQSPRPVRMSAIDALRRVGDDSCLSDLLEMGLESDTELAQSAKVTLADLPGETIDSQIVTLLSDAEGRMYPLLIEIVGRRRIDAVPSLLPALDHSDSVVRSAALVALGETVDLSRLAVLVSQVVDPKHLEDVAVAQQALRAASIRMPDREACAAELTAASETSSSVATKSSLLRILGEMGGTKALATIGAAAKSSDPELQDISSRLLGKWMTNDAAPVLLDLAETAPERKYQVRALRGYIRIARQFRMPEPERAEMCQKAFEVAQYAAEQKLVLEVLERYPNTETFKLAVNALQNPELKDEAAEVTLAIATKLIGKGNDMSALLSESGLETVKLEIVKAEYGSESTQKDVTAVLREQAGNSPLILLASTSYNECFGGDPVPGADKQLKIQYEINGKAGEASFVEDALIILPAPK